MSSTPLLSQPQAGNPLQDYKANSLTLTNYSSANSTVKQTKLSSYEETTVASAAYDTAIVAAATTGIIQCTRLNNKVRIVIPTTAVGVTVATIAQKTVLVPARFRPSGTITRFITGVNNAAAANLNVSLTSTGQYNAGVASGTDGAQANFTVTAHALIPTVTLDFDAVTSL